MVPLIRITPGELITRLCQNRDDLSFALNIALFGYAVFLGDNNDFDCLKLDPDTLFVNKEHGLEYLYTIKLTSIQIVLSENAARCKLKGVQYFYVPGTL
jgi:hypothetical protein